MTEREHLDLIRRKTGFVEARGDFDGSVPDPRLAITLEELAYLIGAAAVAGFDTETEDRQ